MATTNRTDMYTADTLFACFESTTTLGIVAP